MGQNTQKRCHCEPVRRLVRNDIVLFGYERWENFDKAISRAMESCETSGIEVSDHFREVTKMVALGSGSKRSIKDYTM